MGMPKRHIPTRVVKTEKPSVAVVVKKSKLPPKKKPPKQSYFAKEPSAWLVVDSSEENEDGTSITIILSRRPTPDEKDQINEAIYEECNNFVAFKNWRANKLRVTVNINVGEPLCHRQAVECVEEAIRNM